MQLLEDAIERIRPAFEERIRSRVSPEGKDNTYVGDKDYGYFTGQVEPNATVARLRLDWEFYVNQDDRSEQEALDNVFSDPSTLVNLMLDNMRPDLLDLIEDGDVDSGDALLKAIEGTKKRGKEVQDLDIFRASLYWQYLGGKKSLEFTVYILIYIKFEE